MNSRPLLVRLDRFFGKIKAMFSGARIHPSCRISSSAEISVWKGGQIEIGAKCRIHKGAIITTLKAGRVTIGDDCTVNPYTIIYGPGGVWIGNSVRIAAHSVIIAANHSFDDPDVPISKQASTRLGITIQDNVWIGAGVRILDGVEILSGCVIAAGAVVNRSTPERGVYAGVPAKLVKKI